MRDTESFRSPSESSNSLTQNASFWSTTTWGISLPDFTPCPAPPTWARFWASWPTTRPICRRRACPSWKFGPRRGPLRSGSPALSMTGKTARRFPSACTLTCTVGWSLAGCCLGMCARRSNKGTSLWWSSPRILLLRLLRRMIIRVPPTAGRSPTRGRSWGR